MIPIVRVSRTLVVLFALWLAIYAASFVSFAVTVPDGDGFTRGLNRAAGFLGWQALAGLIAISVWRSGRNLVAGSSMRWLTRLPLALFLLPGFLLFAALVWATAS